MLSLHDAIALLYRSLLGKALQPDLSQHRVAIHLEKLYNRLKDYQPEIEYSQRLDQVTRAINEFERNASRNNHEDASKNKWPFAYLRGHKKNNDSLALVQVLSSHESALRINSPKGMLLHGEVGTGKSMLVDLLADCLPNKNKRRWHYNSFMLELYSRLENMREYSLAARTCEYSMLMLARESIETTPIVFLDEFQFPDRAASKLLMNLFTPFFQLGGVLIATFNRTPEELATAAGIEFRKARTEDSNTQHSRLRYRETGNTWVRRETNAPGKGDFAQFLEVLQARCDVIRMEGDKDWRRQNAADTFTLEPVFQERSNLTTVDRTMRSDHVVYGSRDLGNPAISTETPAKLEDIMLPHKYFIIPKSLPLEEFNALMQRTNIPDLFMAGEPIAWKSGTFEVYGRIVNIPNQFSGVTMWTFSELCRSNLGPADYITLPSNYHTLILTNVPILTLQQKNEARRFITLLDALYETRCKLLISAKAGPDDIFFPETNSIQNPNDSGVENVSQEPTDNDSIYAESFSEIYQGSTTPFRPNTSSYDNQRDRSIPLRTAVTIPPKRSVLADEDADFGPIHQNVQAQFYNHPDDPTNPRYALDFSKADAFTGTDEKFAYKRAVSRLWEMCSDGWWSQQNTWRPLDPHLRTWEKSNRVRKGRKDDLALPERVTAPVSVTDHTDPEGNAVDPAREQAGGHFFFKHGASSPFRKHPDDAPPKFSLVHFWGVMKWGKRAGRWGQGPEGLDGDNTKGS
ncbi:MAG: hypothetical protein M1834_001897 [Cirrosporium novae-zelandiae]|nr:MAG: hypothetical protein M1834_001897 [Cirrosporium novae-zelandiae]